MKQKESSVKSSELLKSNLGEKILSKRKIDGNVTLQTFDADVFLLKPQESHICLLESFRKDGEASETILVFKWNINKNS